MMVLTPEKHSGAGRLAHRDFREISFPALTILYNSLPEGLLRAANIS